MAGSKSTEGADHWDFLELIEAPMWVDLTIEAELMEKDSDDAWFRISHPVHQMSSRQLRSSSLQDNGKCLSPKASDSVSRSRGKHYKSRRWEENGQDPPPINKDNIRKLNGRSLGATLEKAASSSSSTITATMSSSCRKPFSNLAKKSIGKAGSVAEKTLSNSVTTYYKNLRSKSSTGGPGSISNVKKQSSIMACNSTIGDSRKTGNSTGKILMGKEAVQNRKSSTGKSSVGSSSTLGPILEVVNSEGPGSICNSTKQSSRMVCSSTKGYGRKTVNSTENVKEKEALKNHNSTTGKSSVGSSYSLGPILEVVNSGGPGSICNAKKHYSRMVCNSTKGYGRKTVNSTGNIKEKEVLQNRYSSTGKSSVGSSCSLGPILEVVNSDEMKNVGCKRDKNGSDSSVQLSKEYVEGRSSFACCQDRPRGQMSSGHEFNSKDLRSVAPRKPLTLLNGSRTTKEFGLETRKINDIRKLGPAYNKEKATERRKLQNLEAVEGPIQSSGCVRKNLDPLQNKENTRNGKLLNSEAMRRKTLFSSTKGKPSSNMQARNSVAAFPVTNVR